MAKWNFNCIDNGGKRQNFMVTASDKTVAIRKGFEKAKKNAKGDIISWKCSLRQA